MEIVLILTVTVWSIGPAVFLIIRNILKSIKMVCDYVTDHRNKVPRKKASDYHHTKMFKAH